MNARASAHNSQIGLSKIDFVPIFVVNNSTLSYSASNHILRYSPMH